MAMKSPMPKQTMTKTTKSTMTKPAPKATKKAM
jgi:hypothetical protein